MVDTSLWFNWCGLDDVVEDEVFFMLRSVGPLTNGKRKHNKTHSTQEKNCIIPSGAHHSVKNAESAHEPEVRGGQAADSLMGSWVAASCFH